LFHHLIKSAPWPEPIGADAVKGMMAQHNAHPTATQVLDLLVETLARHSALSLNDERALRRLHPLVRKVARGADIVRQGDRPEIAVMVVSGMLARYHTAPNGDRQYLSLHIAGDLPDLQSLFLGVMDHSVCALNVAQIAAFPHSQILALVKRAPSAGLAFWRHTLIDAAIFRQAITSIGKRSAVARVAHLFCEQFTRARAVGSLSGWSCPFPLSQTQIGQVVGLSLPTIHRATQFLHKEHCAEVRSGTLRILNWRRLCKQADFDPIYLHADLGERD
jgi:CRP-like cAMP-binding protein